MPGNLKGWELLIIVGLIVLLFGAKRLPDAARGLGRSLRIFKAETKGLTESDSDGDDNEIDPPVTASESQANTPTSAAETTPAEPNDR
ncbi:MAG: Sec-independent protein translocase subunit TatA [Candidatus Nanopelagicales bacterium]|nr:Sec-independent protein translocase subunit TatA [Candidatus Nanopelagicales bacterium]